MSWDSHCTPVKENEVERTWLLAGNTNVGFGVWGTYPKESQTESEVNQFLTNCCTLTSKGSEASAPNGLIAGKNRYTFIGVPANVLVLMSKKDEGDTDADKHGVVATRCVDYDKDTDVYLVYRLKAGFSARGYTSPITAHANTIHALIKTTQQQQQQQKW